ncbi:transposable element Tcb1 transposase [Trichonephila clavipes]|nr:transposable element Tcb1 transposase [Trichonephila clavipes]
MCHSGATCHVCFGAPWVLEFLFLDAPPHRANIVDEFHQSEDITRMDWPTYSPDLNPIEHVGICLADELQPFNPLPPVYRNFRRALFDQWCNIPQDQIDNLILSMPRRCKACIASSRDILRINHYTNHVILFL